MKLFKKENYVTIVADDVTNFEVQRFADEHSSRKRVIDVMRADKFIAVRFYTKKEQSTLLEKLKARFNNIYKVEVWEDLIVVKQ